MLNLAEYLFSQDNQLLELLPRIKSQWVNYFLRLEEGGQASKNSNNLTKTRMGEWLNINNEY